MIILLVYIAALITDAASFTITPLQSVVKERAGNFVPLGVTITDASPSLDEITWEFSKNGGSYSPITSPRITRSDGGKQLNIALLRDSDVGIYRITITTKNGTSSIQVTKSEIIRVERTNGWSGSIALSPASPIQVNVSETINITVQLGNSDGSAKVAWYKGVSPLYDGGRYNSSEITQGCSSNWAECWMLQINGSTPDDIGDYAVVTSFQKTVNGELITQSDLTEFTVEVHGTPIVRVEPLTHRVMVGTDTVFTCIALGYPAPNITWYMNGNSTDQHGKYLKIKNVAKSDAGTYMCQANATYPSVANSSINVTSTAHASGTLVINIDNTITVLTPVVVANVAQASSLQIELLTEESVYEHTITWYQDSAEVIAGADISFLDSKKTLNFKTVRADHQGYYRVVVQLTTVTLEGHMQLLVKDAKPVIAFRQGSYIGRKGQQTVFNIDISGNPYPEISQINWYHKDNLIVSGTDSNRLSDNKLELKKSSLKEGDEGEIKVIVSTSAGTSEEITSLRIITLDEIEIIVGNQNQISGYTISFEVAFHILPMPIEQNVQWKKSSTTISDTDSRIDFYDSRQKLQISNIDSSDSGMYTIRVDKADGTQISKSMDLQVKDSSESMQFTSKPNSLYMHKVGETATITCVASGTPSPLMTFYYKNSTNLGSQGRFYQQSTGVLKIFALEVEDSNKYKCTAHNGDDSDISYAFDILVIQIVNITMHSDTVKANLGGTATFTAYVQPPQASVVWAREGINIPYSDGGHYSISSSINSTYLTETLTVNNFQASDAGQYEATAHFSDHTNRTVMQLNNGGSSVISLTNHPDDTSIYQGQTVAFTCEVSGTGSSMSWTKDGADVLSFAHKRYSLDSSKHVLTIAQSDYNGDGGVYVCTATKEGESVSASAALTVLRPVSITEYPLARRIIEGSTITLSVQVQSADINSQTIKWSKNGALTGETIDQKIITSARKSDSGVYKVKAILSSWMGQSSFEDEVAITVFVMDKEEMQPAEIIQAPTDQTAILGSTVTFDCLVTGIPDPTVKWSNGSADMSKENYTVSYTDAGIRSKLTIHNIRREFQGDYRCKADNGVGDIKVISAFLEIIDPPVPTITRSQQYVVTGTALSITATVQYSSPLNINMTKWTRNSQTISTTATDISITQNDGRTLYIPSVQKSHEGIYSFLVITPAGQASASFSLQVIKKYVDPTVSLGVKDIVTSSEGRYDFDLIATHSTTFIMKCDVTGKPIPIVTWMVNGTDVPLKEGVYEQMSDNSLKIYRVAYTDAGEYVCKAEQMTPEGSKFASAKLSLGVVNWLASPFIYAYPYDNGLTEKRVVSGDTLELNIEVMYRYQVRAHNIMWFYLKKKDAKEKKLLTTVNPGYDNKIRFARNRRQLNVESINDIYSGYYECIVTTLTGNDSVMIKATVIARVTPTIQFEPQNNERKLYSVAGLSDFVFNVSVKGEPFPERINWYVKKDLNTWKAIANDTVNTPPKYTQSWFGDLYMSKIQMSSANTYKISVSPPEGGSDQNAEAVIDLIVRKYHLGIDRDPYIGGTKTIGDSVTIVCKAIGVPSPESYNWYKVSDRSGITLLDTKSDEYVIENINKNSIGDYYCMVQNIYGKLYSIKASLRVQYLDTRYGPTKCYKAVKSDTSKGMMECTSNNLVEGDVFTLKCNGPQGYPYPKTTWWKNDVAITQSNNGLDPTIDATGNLVFPWAHPDNSGDYKCQNTNSASKDAINTYTISVNVQAGDTSKENAKSLEWLAKPTELIAEVYTPVTIACIVSSYPVATYKWTKGNQQVSDGNGKSLDFSKRLLVFGNIGSEDGGTYKCSATMDDGSNKFADFELKVATKPALSRTIVTQKGVLGNETEIDVPGISGEPFPTITWTFNGAGISLGDRFKLKASRILVIDPTEAEDEGVYQITASNKAGSAQHSLYLEIVEPLEFVSLPDSAPMMVPLYGTATFPCNAKGRPAPIQYIWSRADHLHEPFNGLPARATVLADHSLQIPLVEPWDNGTYVCNVTNKYFETISASGDLEVIQPPVIVIPPTDNYVGKFGENAVLTCKCEPQAVAKEMCQVKWRKDGLDANSRARVTVKDDFNYASVLQVTGTQSSDLGIYTCHGSNSVGVTSANATIYLSPEPSIKLAPNDVTESNSNTITLQCVAIGASPINYLWRQDGKAISDSRFTTSETGTLTVENTKGTDSGRYTCYAANPYGIAEASATVAIKDAPSKPPAPWISEILVVNNLVNVVVKIGVDNTGNDPITKYVLKYYYEDDSNNIQDFKTLNYPSQSTYTWENMKASTKGIQFAVQVQNSIGASPLSDMSGVTQIGNNRNSVPKKPVTKLEVTDQELLKWEAAGDFSQTVTYIIYYKYKGDRVEKKITDQKTTSYSLQNIESMVPYGEYEVTVAPEANNVVGIRSEVYHYQKKPDNPGQPTITGVSSLNDDDLLVEYDVKWNTTFGALSKIIINYTETGQNYATDPERRRKKRDGAVASVEVSFAAKNKLIQGLNAGQNYKVDIRTVNANGDYGVISNPANYSVKEGIPGLCDITYLEGSGRDAIEVQWRAPDINKGTIRGFFVYYKLANSFTETAAKIRVMDASVDNYNITGLDAQVKYSVSVTAYTLAGEGDRVDWIDATTRDVSIPKQMDVPQAGYVNWHTIYVKWDLKDDGLTGVDTFTITVQDRISTEPQTYIIPDRRDRYTEIHSLEPDHFYDIYIQATNHIGTSDISPSVQFHMKKKPLHMRMWFAGTMTASFTAVFLILFIVLLCYLQKKQTNKLVMGNKRSTEVPDRASGRFSYSNRQVQGVQAVNNGDNVSYKNSAYDGSMIVSNNHANVAREPPKIYSASQYSAAHEERASNYDRYSEKRDSYKPDPRYPREDRYAPSARDDNRYAPSDAGRYPPSERGGYAPSENGRHAPSENGRYAPSDSNRYAPSDAGRYAPSETGRGAPQPRYAPSNAPSVAPSVDDLYPPSNRGYPDNYRSNPDDRYDDDNSQYSNNNLKDNYKDDDFSDSDDGTMFSNPAFKISQI